MKQICCFNIKSRISIRNCLHLMHVSWCQMPKWGVTNKIAEKHTHHGCSYSLGPFTYLSKNSIDSISAQKSKTSTQLWHQWKIKAIQNQFPKALNHLRRRREVFIQSSFDSLATSQLPQRRHPPTGYHHREDTETPAHCKGLSKSLPWILWAARNK